jgi:site-specific DNA-cytosine methylase
MNVLSLFDGMSCGQLALQRSGLKVSKYFASEGVSNTQRYRMLGNGWTVDVICHLFQNLQMKGA